MRIAIPLVDQGTLAEEFSRANLFALYDVHDQTRAVGYVGREAIAEPGCGRTPPVLRQHGVEVVLGHRVSENAVNHLLEVGIVAIKDAPLLTADALIAQLVSGTLMATAPEAATQGGCGGSHGCGQCGHHAHEPAPAKAEEACGTTCGDGHGSQGCCGHGH